MTDFCSNPSLVILIDCWNTNDRNDLDTMNRIVEFCSTASGPQAIALATYASFKGEEIVKEEPWYSNSKNLFYDRTRWEPLRDVWDQARFIDNPGPDSFTYSTVANLPHTNQHSDKNFFILWHHDQLAYYLNYIRPSIRNIILAGFHWNSCIRWRRMGHEGLSRLVKYKIISPEIQILTNRNLVGCVPGESCEIYSPWQDLGNDWFGINFDLLDY